MGRQGRLGERSCRAGDCFLPDSVLTFIFLPVLPLSSSYKLLPRIIEAKYLDAMDAEY